jgi:ADP-ribose pyrophosphatase YjhB (NUDIX family)
MHIVIYFDDKPVYLCDGLTADLKEILHHPDAVFIEELSNKAIKSLLHEIVKDEFHAGVILHNDFEALKKSFFRHFTPIQAAGGIVQNNNKEILFIERLGKWDLPKGKIEAGEKEDEAAIREIEEETGLKNLTLKNKIGETYHTYNAYGKHFIKTIHWFDVINEKDENLIPQTEEDITLVEWIATKDIKKPMSNTYASIKEIMNKFFDEA